MGSLVVIALGVLLSLGSLRAQVSVNSPSTSHILLSQAAGLHAQGAFNRSYAVLEEALTATAKERNEVGRAKCLLRMGITKWDLGDVTGSVALFEGAATSFRDIQDRRSLEFCAKCCELVQLYDQGREDRRNGLGYRAGDRLNEALAVARDLGLSSFLLKCLRQAALVSFERGELEPFLEKSRCALTLAALAHHRLEQGRCLNNIGVYYQRRADYAQAVMALEQARSVFGSLGDGSAEAESLSNLGLAYRELGNPDRAYYFLSEALARDQARGDLTAVSMDWTNIGSVLLRRGIDEGAGDDLHRALKAFQNGLRTQESIGPAPMTLFTALSNMGIVLGELRDYAGARARFLEALEIATRHGGHFEQSQALVNIATSYLGEMEVDEALSYYASARRVSGTNADPFVRMGSYLGQGRCYEQKGDNETALLFYRQAIQALEDVKAGLPEPFLIGFSRNKNEAYDRSIRIWADRYDRSPSEKICATVFDLVERARARAFLDSLSAARPDLSSSERQRIQDRQKAIAGSIADLQARLVSQALSENVKRAFVHEIECAEEESVRLSIAFKEAGPSRARDWERNVLPLRDVQALLRDEDSVLLEYVLGDPVSYLLRVSSSSVRLYRLPSRTSLERSLRAYRRSLSDRSLDPHVGLLAAERIGRELLPPDDDESLRQIGGLIIVPDGFLHDLPFEALRIPGRSGSRYLIERSAVSYCPSASALALLKARARPRAWRKQILAIGSPDYESLPPGPDGRKISPLPFSLQEIRAIARYYPAPEIDLLSGPGSREDLVKARPLNEYRIIHFACHGFLDEKAPFRSALVLSSGRGAGNDGYLQMREVYGLSLSADLVVLSACQTGAGRIEASEGPLALARPFFFAGARAVVASLWPIGDQSTVLFMREFYRRISAGQPAALGLREAKLGMLRSRWSHPFYWAGFLLQGDPTALGTGTAIASPPTGAR
jgi:CHAT domain-containing protein/Tfp pilus assembly protein PilF